MGLWPQSGQMTVSMIDARPTRVILLTIARPLVAELPVQRLTVALLT